MGERENIPMQVPSEDTTPASPSPMNGNCEKKKGRGGLIALLVLAAGYVGLCGYAARPVLWPGTTVLGVDVSGLNEAAAVAKVTRQYNDNWDGQSMTFTEPESGKSFTLELSGLMEPADPAEAVAEACQKEEGAFLFQGGRMVFQLLSGGESSNGGLTYTAEGKERMDTFLKQVDEALGLEGNGAFYTLEEDSITFTRGVTSTIIDLEKVRKAVTQAVYQGGEAQNAQLTLRQITPNELDFQVIRDEVFSEPVDARYDVESGNVIPAQMGRDFDPEEARAAYQKVGEGESCTVELTLTAPRLGTSDLKNHLFTQTLATAATRFTGSASRKKNIALACQFVNDQVIQPGESFSFNDLCGPYDVSKGYGKAGAYVNGKTVDTTAGGICQASSTIYWAALKANLEITERHAHRYEPAYIRGGLDATVYGDSLDLKFVNNTGYPLKMRAYIDKNNYVQVSIVGADLRGIHGEPYSTNRVVTQEAVTLYEANAATPAGTLQKDPERTAYNAVSIDTYQKLVDANGKTVSETKLYRTNYKVRNAVYFYHPGEEALWGIDPATGIRTEVVETAQPSQAPAESPAQESPAETTAPTESQQPEQTTAPESPAPAQSDPPAESSPAPESTPAPEQTPAPSQGGEEILLPPQD